MQRLFAFDSRCELNIYIYIYMYICIYILYTQVNAIMLKRPVLPPGVSVISHYKQCKVTLLSLLHTVVTSQVGVPTQMTRSVYQLVQSTG